MSRTVTNARDAQKNIHDILVAINAALTVTGADMTDVRLMMDGLLEIWEGSWYMDELGL